MGKTSFALNLARNVAVKAKKKTLMFSLEMTKEQLAMRVLGTEARVSSKKMRSGQIDQDEWVRLGTAANVLGDCPLYFDDTSAITVPEMKAKTRRLSGVDCVIVDYLGLVRPSTKAENRVNEVSEITRNLKMMAKDLNIPVICCAQLSRGTETRGKSHKPQLADLRESGSIEQDADMVLFLYRPEYYSIDQFEDNTPSAGLAEIMFEKNRHGSTGSVRVRFISRNTRFVDMEQPYMEGQEQTFTDNMLLKPNTNFDVLLDSSMNDDAGPADSGATDNYNESDPEKLGGDFPF
jgi:replicative DNA helicase